ncbi:unnamed protein product [Schistosoma bovis]|uniref:Uncharacterized protein n=1 Tax=Schistosoma bovis TaxID=6184 RepID=A0A430QDW0_SCHBO|nr:uncharacterized protein DC041_0000236 [Schistosoma bovis]CAH8534119.1 unnamed protein product [Schistosoma bovis]CAH8537115.1 unnamed protein product [Schistosoma bovis]
MRIHSISTFALIIICVFITNSLLVNGQMAEYYMNDEMPQVNTYENMYPRYIQRHRSQHYKRGGMYGGLLGK